MLFSDAPETQESPTSAALLPLFRASAKPISISLLIYTLHKIFSAVKARLFHRFCKKNGCGILAEFEEIRLRCAVCLSASESSRTGNGRKDETRIREIYQRLNSDLERVADLPIDHFRALIALVSSIARIAGTFVASAWLFIALDDLTSPIHDSAQLFRESKLFVDGFSGVSAAVKSTARALALATSRHLTTLRRILVVLWNDQDDIPRAFSSSLKTIWPSFLCLFWLSTTIIESYMTSSLISTDQFSSILSHNASYALRIVSEKAGKAELVEGRFYDLPLRLLPYVLKCTKTQNKLLRIHQDSGPILKKSWRFVMDSSAIAKLCIVVIWRAALGMTLKVADIAVYILLVHGVLCGILENLASSSTRPPLMSGSADPLSGQFLKRMVVVFVATFLMLNGNSALRETALSIRGLNLASKRSSILSDIQGVKLLLTASKFSSAQKISDICPHDGLRFNDVWVASGTSKEMSPQTHYSLRGLTLHAPGGSIVVILGSSGTGKTSLIEAMMWANTCRVNNTAFPSFLPRLEHGELIFQGRNVNEWDLQSWKKQVSVLRQNRARFCMTLAENIIIGKRSEDDILRSSTHRKNCQRTDIVEALSLAGAAYLVDSLPDGLDTLLMDDDNMDENYFAEARTNAKVVLSSGEWNAVARARAFAGFDTSKLILLDDPTVCMSEIEIEEFMGNLRRRVHEAPHRPVVVIATQDARLCDEKFSDIVAILGRGGAVLDVIGGKAIAKETADATQGSNNPESA